MDTISNPINAYDGDGHVEEWEGTFSDEYLEPAFRDRRPTVFETGEFEHDYKWLIDGDELRIGGSPSSKERGGFHRIRQDGQVARPA